MHDCRWAAHGRLLACCTACLVDVHLFSCAKVWRLNEAVGRRDFGGASPASCTWSYKSGGPSSGRARMLLAGELPQVATLLLVIASGGSARTTGQGRLGRRAECLGLLFRQSEHFRPGADGQCEHIRNTTTEGEAKPLRRRSPGTGSTARNASTRQTFPQHLARRQRRRVPHPCRRRGRARRAPPCQRGTVRHTGGILLSDGSSPMSRDDHGHRTEASTPLADMPCAA
mmetsp:Transcript_55657/g.180637  ORF Transcript_55657/g.180637 Transcript_55657/m.180637 type:complete len:228 (+) Transcript_55657:2952-3635(+)